MDQAADPVLLDRALALGYVVFTQDVDFLAEAARRQRAGERIRWCGLRKATRRSHRRAASTTWNCWPRSTIRRI